LKLCECGCGLPAPIATYSSKRYGWIKGQPKRFIHNHHLKGDRNVNFNHGLCFSEGRWWIHCRDNTYTQYARAVVAASLKRDLEPEEVVHHIDHDSANDELSNLQLCKNQQEHMKLHLTYTDNDLLQALIRKAQELGREPMSSDIESDHHMPTRETYRIRLGGLKKAKQIAGLSKSNNKSVVKVI
jgi:hypothetical protein